MSPFTTAAFEAALARAVDAEHVAVKGGVFPAFHVAPASAAEICEVVVACREHRVPLHPAGVGGRPSYAPDDRPRVVLATRRLAQVVQLDETSLLVEAQAGLGGLELERILARRGASRVCTRRPLASTADTATTASSKKPWRALLLPGVRTARMPPRVEDKTTGG